MTLLAITAFGRLAEHAGVLAVTLLAAISLVAGARPRLRAAAMLAALALTPVLLGAAVWNSPQVRPLRHHTLYVAAGIGAALLLVVLLAVLFSQRRQAVALLALAALPFRLPISVGGQTFNLLVPLYLVIAAGVLSVAVRALRGREHEEEPAVGTLEGALAAVVLLYGIQSSYSHDFMKALENIAFFYAPFALLFVLLRRVTYSERLLRGCLGVLGGLALCFAAIGFYEYSRRELLLNPKVIAANMLEPYFRVNSLFFDPNIYGRFLALVMLALAAAMLWSTRRRLVVGAMVMLAVLWAGLMTTISQSSIVALLVGLAVLAALRFNTRRTVAFSGALVAAGVAFLLLAGSSVHFDLGSAKAADSSTSGRYTLMRGGLNLFTDRPLEGYGPGSFAREYRQRQRSSNESAVSASHTTPITVAAEQGVLGLFAYLVLLGTAFARLFGPDVRRTAARAAIAACFTALVLHTMLYADFLEDPVLWALLGIGTALAAARSQPHTAEL